MRHNLIKKGHFKLMHFYQLPMHNINNYCISLQKSVDIFIKNL